MTPTINTSHLQGLDTVYVIVDKPECEELRGCAELQGALYLLLTGYLEFNGFQVADVEESIRLPNRPCVRFTPWFLPVTGAGASGQPCNVGFFVAWELQLAQYCVLYDNALASGHAITWRNFGTLIIRAGEDVLDALTPQLMTAVENFAAEVKDSQ